MTHSCNYELTLRAVCIGDFYWCEVDEGVMAMSTH